MNTSPNVPAADDRREFLRGILRLTAAASVGSVTLLAVWRSGGQWCRRDGLCGECPIATQCELPRAADWRATPPERRTRT